MESLRNNFDVDLWVVDPAVKSGFGLHFFSLEDVSRCDFDVIIHSATSSSRVNCLSLLRDRFEWQLLLIEKPIVGSFYPNDSLLEQLRDLENAYVNISVRYWDQLFASILADSSGPLRFVVEGGTWGLLCNYMHWCLLVNFYRPFFLDEVVFEGFKETPSKRAGFSEAFGCARITSGEVSLELEAKKHQKDRIKIISNDKTLDFDFSTKTIHVRNCSGKLIEKSIFSEPYQSILTARYWRDFHEGRLRLPRLSEALEVEQRFVSAVRRSVFNKKLIAKFQWT